MQQKWSMNTLKHKHFKRSNVLKTNAQVDFLIIANSLIRSISIEFMFLFWYSMRCVFIIASFFGANSKKMHIAYTRNMTFIEIVIKHGIKPKKTSISPIVVLYSIEVFLLASISLAFLTLPFLVDFISNNLLSCAISHWWFSPCLAY